MREVLAVLDHHEDRLWHTFDAAVELAERERSRLTLVQCCAPANVYLWLSPYAICGAYMTPNEDPQAAACRNLAQAVRSVPGDIPVTTLVLGSDTRRHLCRLIHSGAFDAVVGPAVLFRRARRLTRELRRLGVQVVPVGGRATAAGPHAARTGSSAVPAALPQH